MADNNVFSVRLEEQDKEKLMKMIQESGRNNKEFMSVLLSDYELNKTKIQMPDIAKDIEGLQALTQRINEYYVNIGKRVEDTQKAKDLQYTKDIVIYRDKIEILKEDNEKLKTDGEVLQQAYNNSCDDINDNKKQLDQLQEIQETNKILIKEYQSKIDTLSGIIEEYKGYKAANETLKNSLADQQTDSFNKDNIIKDKDYKINKLNLDIKSKDDNINDLKLKHEDELQKINDYTEDIRLKGQKQLEELENKHIKDLEQLKKENELNIKLAVAEIRENLNNKLNQEQLRHNSEIEKYQSKYKSLLEEQERLRIDRSK